MSRKKKIILISIVAVIFLAAVFFIIWQKGFWGNSDGRLFKLIQDKPDLVGIFNKVQEAKAAIAKDPENAGFYFNLGLGWKSIGELGGGTPFFQKALEVYEAGIEKFGQKNILFYLNGGKLAERLEDYEKAEKYYKKAIEISSADENGYLYLVDLYSYKMNKSKEDVLKVFEEGQKKMMNSVLLIAGRASYLRRIGDYEMALKDYQLLSENFPDNQGYKIIIAELEQLLKK